MSETPDAPDWWQAADGRWYPPDHHPDHRPAPVPLWRRPAMRTAMAVGAAIGLVGGIVLGLAAGDDSDTVQTTAAQDDGGTTSEDDAGGDGGDGGAQEGADDGTATPTAAATATPEPVAETPTPAPTEAPEATAEPDPTATAAPTVPSAPEPSNAVVLANDGLAVVTFNAASGASIDQLAAELGPPTFDSRWITLEHASPTGGGFADDPVNPTLTFSFNRYRQVCWGDLVMLCTLHGRNGDEPGIFVGWEQAHRAPLAYGSEATEDPAMGASAAGAAVGRAASLLGPEVELRRGSDATVVASGTYDVRVAGTWPDGVAEPDTNQPVLCIAAGNRPRVPGADPCAVPVLATNPVNRIARTVVRRAIVGLEPVFLAERVAAGPTADAGYVAFDSSEVEARLASLASLDDDATIEAAPDLVPNADPAFGGTSCGLPGDVSVVCAYRIVANDGTVVTAEVILQNTGVVDVVLS